MQPIASQNLPLSTKDFINLCKDRMIELDEETVEYFQRRKLLIPIDRQNNTDYYSSFQLHWVRLLKRCFKIDVNFANNDDIEVSANIEKVDGKDC